MESPEGQVCDDYGASSLEECEGIRNITMNLGQSADGMARELPVADWEKELGKYHLPAPKAVPWPFGAEGDRKEKPTKIQAQKVTAHAVIYLGTMENELPLGLWGDLGSSP